MKECFNRRDFNSFLVRTAYLLQSVFITLMLPSPKTKLFARNFKTGEGTIQLHRKPHDIFYSFLSNGHRQKVI
jgi:hypothetical protein